MFLKYLLTMFYFLK